MADSLSEMLKQDMQCENLLECFHGMGDLERRIFSTVVDAEEPMTVDEIAERVDRERSTTYRGVQKLQKAGFVQREQVNYDQGGYYHVYKPVESERVAKEMQRMLNDWYAQMGQLIQEFQDKYEEPAAIEVES